MKGLTLFIALLTTAILPWCSGQLASAKATPDTEQEDKTLSPYFFVKSEDPELDQLPLKSTSAVASISGVIADVVVKQVYKNEGKKTLEAVYIFPASTRAAVYGMQMIIGERTIIATIDKREEARKVYENAKQAGKSASLLEEHRPNVFQMNVANILPGDEIVTELRYTELLAPTDGIYEFVYPTVVGPRYSNKPASSAQPSERWSQNPYLHEGEAPSNTFDIKVNLAAGIPIQEISCSTHKTNIHYADKTSAVVALDPSEKFGANRDFVLRYRLAGEKIESGLLLFEGEQENFFLLMMQPPQRVPATAIPPREYIFIVDVSGSMNGYPLMISKKLVKDLISGLRPSDTFNVLLFAGGSRIFSERSLPANPQNIQNALGLLDRTDAGGGTELLPALRRALGLPPTEGVSRTIIIATDGYVDVEPEIFDLVRERTGEANIFTFGIGTAVNRHLIEGMARLGSGESFVVDKEVQAAAMAEKFRHYVESPVLTKSKVDFGKFEAYDVEPHGVPDLFAQRPVLVFGKWKGKPLGTITLSGISGNENYSVPLDLEQIRPSAENSALRYLWARARIAQLGDYNKLKSSDERVAKITQLGLKYNLLTAYTSFVAVDTQIRRTEGGSTTVKQPLPLPEGVSDLAVGGERAMSMQVPASPLPHFGFSGGASMDISRKNKIGRSAPTMAKEEPSAAETPPKRELSVDTVSIRGAFAESKIWDFLKNHTEEILQCAGLSTKAPAGKITITWTVDSKGAVKDIQVSSQVTGGFNDCLRERMKNWVFEPTGNGKEVKVTVIMSLRNKC